LCEFATNVLQWCRGFLEQMNHQVMPRNSYKCVSRCCICF